ncbi:MAG: VOC family protein [Nocardioides sp.]|uniref:VOC family protein n=1 Tax=Nocardioides sp. TaxID=35761 RepID=UPI0039E2C194
MSVPATEATDHVGYVVADLAEAKAAFARLGFVVLVEEDLGAFGLRQAMLQSGTEKIELLRILDPELDRARRGDDRMRLDHVAYQVDDLEAAFLALRAAGATVVDPIDRPIEEPLDFGDSRHLWATLGGLRLQFLQPVGQPPPQGP